MKKIKHIFFVALLVTLVACMGKNMQVYAKTELDKPTNVKALNPKLDTLVVKWSKVKGADGYYLYYSTSKSSGYKVINVGNNTGAIITGISDRTKYYFKVKAYTSIGVVSEMSDAVSGKNKVFGIDVSYHQGTIDWDKVKSQVDFVILRVGYGDNITSQDDKQWKRNADECTRLGIPFGVYIYSYATNTAQASSEAEHVKRLVAGYNLSYPVYYDLEDAGTTGTVAANVKGDMAQTFCDIIKGAGYKVGIYANTYWFNNLLTDSRFNQWEKWVAQYSNACTYGGTYRMWQYSSSVPISGIAGAVDANYRYSGMGTNMNNKPTVNLATQGVYLPSPSGVVAQTTGSNSATVTWNPVAGSTRYIVYRKKAGDSKYLRVAVTIGTKFEDKNLYEKCTYYYKVCAYTGIAGIEYFGPFSSKVMVNTFIPSPTGAIAVRQSKSKVEVSWNKVDAAGYYKVYRYDPELKKYIKLISTKDNSYTDTRLKTGTAYKYKIVAAKKLSLGTVCSFASEIAKVVTGPDKVETFNGESLEPGSVKLSWNKASGATYYDIYCSNALDGTYKRVITKGKNSKSYTVRNLVSGKNYFFKIRTMREENGVLIKTKFSNPLEVNVK